MNATAPEQLPDPTSTGQPSHCGQDSGDQLLGILPCWPTPLVTEWDDIQTTVTRAFLTLEWLLRQDLASPEAGASQADDLCAMDLIYAIASSIYKLIAGHLLDKKLNMQRVFTSGLLPILEAWSIYGLTNLNLKRLGELLLKRMTTDAAVRSCDKSLDGIGEQRAICAVQQLAKMFGEQSISIAELVCTHKLACRIGCLA